MKIGAGPCTSYIFIIKTETAEKSPVGGGGAELYLRFGGKKIKDIRNTTKKDRENQKENTNERQLFDAIRWRERKTFSSIRRARANFPLVMLSENSQHFPPVQSLSAALRLFSSPFGSRSAFRIFGVSSSWTTLHLKEKLRTLRQSVENQPTCALHYEPENIDAAAPLESQKKWVQFSQMKK